MCGPAGSDAWDLCTNYLTASSRSWFIRRGCMAPLRGLVGGSALGLKRHAMHRLCKALGQQTWLHTSAKSDCSSLFPGSLLPCELHGMQPSKFAAHMHCHM